VAEIEPGEAVRIRVTALTDQLGAAIAEAVRLGFRKAVADQIAEEYGPGPWVLHRDGTVERMPGTP
jgi:hypothetical protein